MNKFLNVFNVFVGFPSPFFTRAALECGDNYILGDSGYPLKPWLITPFRDKCTFPTWERNFNKRHSQQRVAIENIFGLLKQRFRRLYFVDAKSVEQSCYMVMAACVLHNIYNDERDFFQELTSLPQGDWIGLDDVQTAGCQRGLYFPLKLVRPGNFATTWAFRSGVVQFQQM